MEFNEIYQEAWSQLLYQVFVLRADQGKTKIAALASDWLRHFRLLLWNHWTEFNETWQEARSQRLLLPSLCFTDWSENKMAALPLIGWDISDFSSETAEWNLTKLEREQDLNSSTKFSFFGLIREKLRLPPWPLIGWDIFDFSSETTERNSTKLGRKKDLNVFFCQVCVLRTDLKTRWPTWLWLARTFSTSPLKPLNGIQRNLKGSKISTPLPSLCFSGWSEKKKNKLTALASYWLRHFRFSSESTERNSTKLDRKQNLNVFFYYVCVLQTIGKQDSRLASDWLRHLRLLLWNHLKEFNEAWQETRSQLPYQVCVFRADKKNPKDGRTGLWLAETFSTSPVKPLNGIQRSLAGSKISSSSSTKFVFYGPIGKQDDRPGLWLADIFSTSPVKPLNGIQRTLAGSKIASSSFTKFVFYGPIGKQNGRPGLWLADIFFYFTSESTELNSTKFDSNRDLNSSIKFFFGLIG